MKIKRDFGHPYFDEKTIFELTFNDLDCFYADGNGVNRCHLCLHWKRKRSRKNN